MFPFFPHQDLTIEKTQDSVSHCFMHIGIDVRPITPIMIIVINRENGKEDLL